MLPGGLEEVRRQVSNGENGRRKKEGHTLNALQSPCSSESLMICMEEEGQRPSETRLRFALFCSPTHLHVLDDQLVVRRHVLRLLHNVLGQHFKHRIAVVRPEEERMTRGLPQVHQDVRARVSDLLCDLRSVVDLEVVPPTLLRLVPLLVLVRLEREGPEDLGRVRLLLLVELVLRGGEGAPLDADGLRWELFEDLRRWAKKIKRVSPSKEADEGTRGGKPDPSSDGERRASSSSGLETLAASKGDWRVSCRRP